MHTTSGGAHESFGNQQRVFEGGTEKTNNAPTSGPSIDTSALTREHGFCTTKHTTKMHETSSTNAGATPAHAFHCYG